MQNIRCYLTTNLTDQCFKISYFLALAKIRNSPLLLIYECELQLTLKQHSFEQHKHLYVDFFKFFKLKFFSFQILEDLGEICNHLKKIFSSLACFIIIQCIIHI